MLFLTYDIRIHFSYKKYKQVIYAMVFKHELHGNFLNYYNKRKVKINIKRKRKLLSDILTKLYICVHG